MGLRSRGNGAPDARLFTREAESMRRSGQPRQMAIETHDRAFVETHRLEQREVHGAIVSLGFGLWALGLDLGLEPRAQSPATRAQRPFRLTLYARARRRRRNEGRQRPARGPRG